jgi:branched-chain amino acid transport system permease protein
MIDLVKFWNTYGSIVEFAMVWSLLALAQYACHWTGVLNFANPTFAAVAGFGTALLITDFGVSLVPAMIIGGILGAFTALLISFPLLRLSSHWMALATVAVILMTRVFVLNFPSITGGVSGIILRRTSTPFHIIVTLAIAAWVFARLRRSRFGLAVETVRADPEVAATMGINPTRVKRIGFMLAGAIAGVGGVLFADLVQFISPDTFHVHMSFTLFASVILGGGHHWLGPIIGGVIFTLLPEVLRIFVARGEDITNGVILIITMIYLPRGLVQPILDRRHSSRRKVELAQ